VQALGLRLLGSLADGREVVRQSFEVVSYQPQDPAAWEVQYQRFLGLLR
jgi:hypothetical protein